MPYVPNHERIDLGLVGYGSDVPQDVLDAAIAAREQREQLQADRATLKEAKPPKGTRKRVRNAKGHLVADDPATPDVNEAWEEG